MGPGASALHCWFGSVPSAQRGEAAWYRVMLHSLFVEPVRAGTRFIVREVRDV